MCKVMTLETWSHNGVHNVIRFLCPQHVYAVKIIHQLTEISGGDIIRVQYIR